MDLRTPTKKPAPLRRSGPSVTCDAFDHVSQYARSPGLKAQHCGAGSWHSASWPNCNHRQECRQPTECHRRDA